jgi:nucleotide-binding universal stress UspA family protein
MEPRMNRLLLVVDPDSPAHTRLAVGEALRQAAMQPTEVHLLSVQPALTGHVALCFPKGEVERLQQQAGRAELAEALAQLQAHGVAVTAGVGIGRRAETIARTARQIQCDAVVMGPPQEAPRLGHRLFGSVAHQVRHLLEGGGGCRVIGG